ncbi:hypothetical protein BI024_gp39 [Streptomyces phage Nanodon]|uniref:Uncharacterized protein n=1 Tax=Streptomyces phage Nanodon TaxID=1873777 RepID=A0A1B1PA62_9CAUD|nr:hypothetical protein BI024_gp39 [Streptomyces phage Nanodon]ANT41043.1 hypothetical protein SEA_NANODON_39 [Streptomyces phage Nanodon]
MIGFMGWEPSIFEEIQQELWAYLDYIEDPESDIDMVLDVEEFFGVTHAVL